MPTSFRRITGTVQTPELPIYDLDALRDAEQSAASSLGPHALMQRAGLAVARLAIALAPHARIIWIPCGPGNNGGDGMEAALHLLQWGKQPVISLLQPQATMPADAQESLLRAQQAGMTFSEAPPTDWDFCIDALFGIGSSRPLENKCAQWVQKINTHGVPILAVDVPTGLHAFTGYSDRIFVRADATLTLLGAKAGLFMADGRDACGDIWLHTLGTTIEAEPCAQLNSGLHANQRHHNSHKGSYGDVNIVGGCSGMTGAGVLAALGALHGGAGRVYLSLLDQNAPATFPELPELMLRDTTSLDLSSLTVVAGCGGGSAIQAHLPRLLHSAKNLVLDADALNAIANSNEFASLVRQRAPHSTVITPHPLEAARLLHTSTSAIQADRLQAAQTLAHQLLCTVVLKGSGTVIASPTELPIINMSGNAQLATGGTGDVLAGLIGAYLAAGTSGHYAAAAAVRAHGEAADYWPKGKHLTAAALAQSL